MMARLLGVDSARTRIEEWATVYEDGMKEEAGRPEGTYVSIIYRTYLPFYAYTGTSMSMICSLMVGTYNS